MTEMPKTSPAAQEYPWLKSYHKDVRWDLTPEPYPIHDLMDRAKKKFSDKICISFLGKDFKYSEICDLVDRAAKGLQQIGVGTGSKVGLMFPNTPAHVIFYFAILKAGGIVVNYNPLYTLPELEYQIKDSGTELMITHDLKLMFNPVETLLEKGVLSRALIVPFSTFLSPVKSLLFSIAKKKELGNIKGSGQREKIHLYKDVINNDGRYQPVPVDVNKDVAVLQYTGGTTGKPKGAMLSHANLSYNVDQAVHWYVDGVPGEEKIMTILPLFHVFGMTGIMNMGIAFGAELILVPKFDPGECAKLIHTKRPTLMPGVPTIFIAFLNHPKIRNYDLSSLKHCLSGGAPLPVEVYREFTELSGANMPEGYGLSETSPGAVSIPSEGPREGSIGIPISGTVVSIRSLDDPNIEMPLGERGELCIKGPQVMLGYWNKPEATAEVMVGDFFRTGDVGYMDEDGYLYIVDRIKDMILCSGYNVYPRQIEEAIYEHPAVEEVTVIGIPNQYRGEAPKAFVKLRDGQSVSSDEMKEFLKERLSKIEMPEEIEFRDELPKTMVGKLSKKELRAEAVG